MFVCGVRGKYHLVKRMVAAAGNRVEALHRVSIGGLRLPESLSAGQWMWLDAPEMALQAQGVQGGGCGNAAPCFVGDDDDH